MISTLRIILKVMLAASSILVLPSLWNALKLYTPHALIIYAGFYYATMIVSLLLFIVLGLISYLFKTNEKANMWYWVLIALNFAMFILFAYLNQVS